MTYLRQASPMFEGPYSYVLRWNMHSGCHLLEFFEATTSKYCPFRNITSPLSNYGWQFEFYYAVLKAGMPHVHRYLRQHAFKATNPYVQAILRVQCCCPFQKKKGKPIATVRLFNPVPDPMPVDENPDPASLTVLEQRHITEREELEERI